MRWYWPNLSNVKDAEQAAHRGGWACFVLAGGMVFAVGMGASTWDFCYALILLIAGWRIWQLSRIWAVLVLVWAVLGFVALLVVGIALGPLVFIPILLNLAFTVVLIDGVRGTFAYHAIMKKEPAAPVGG